MVKRRTNYSDSNQINNSVTDFSEIEKFKLTDAEIRNIYPEIKDEEIGVLQEILVDFAKMLYNKSNN